MNNNKRLVKTFLQTVYIKAIFCSENKKITYYTNDKLFTTYVTKPCNTYE